MNKLEWALFHYVSVPVFTIMVIGYGGVLYDKVEDWWLIRRPPQYVKDAAQRWAKENGYDGE